MNTENAHVAVYKSRSSFVSFFFFSSLVFVLVYQGCTWLPNVIITDQEMNRDKKFCHKAKQRKRPNEKKKKERRKKEENSKREKWEKRAEFFWKFWLKNLWKYNNNNNNYFFSIIKLYLRTILIFRFYCLSPVYKNSLPFSSSFLFTFSFRYPSY